MDFSVQSTTCSREFMSVDGKSSRTPYVPFLPSRRTIATRRVAGEDGENDILPNGTFVLPPGEMTLSGRAAGTACIGSVLICPRRGDFEGCTALDIYILI